MAKLQPWEQWEKDVQDRLGLDSTICSGNKWHDIGDATDNSHPSSSQIRLLIDCKHTTKGSWSLNAAKVREWITAGLERGKLAIMAIRFATGEEFAVLAMDDFEELLEKARTQEKIKVNSREPRCPNAGRPCFCTGVCLPKYPQGPNFSGSMGF